MIGNLIITVGTQGPTEADIQTRAKTTLAKILTYEVIYDILLPACGEPLQSTRVIVLHSERLTPSLTSVRRLPFFRRSLDIPSWGAITACEER
jgi:hypothetical protein